MTTKVSEGGLPPDSLGSSPAHLIVYKIEPPVCVVPSSRLRGRIDALVLALSVRLK